MAPMPDKLIADNEYQCTMCDGVFEKGRSDDEAMKESKEKWGAVPEDDLGVVCDSCYLQMFGWPATNEEDPDDD